MSQTNTEDQDVPRFVVFNYVSNKIEQSETAPEFGDPNSGLQAAASNAYTGSVAGAASLSSATTTPGTTPATIGDPAAQAIAAAQANLTPELAQTVTQAFGAIGQIGQVPNMLTAMHAHATNVVENATKVFDAIDTIFRPEEVGSANRCLSLGDFIGSVQGKFNTAITGITQGLNGIANALIGVPLTVINSVVGAANALTAAITSGITSAINSAITAVTEVTQGFFNTVGKTVTALFNSVGSAVQTVFDGITNEINNVAGALSQLINSPFRLVVPNVNPCLKSVLEQGNANFSAIRSIVPSF